VARDWCRVVDRLKQPIGSKDGYRTLADYQSDREAVIQAARSGDLRARLAVSPPSEPSVTRATVCVAGCQRCLPCGRSQSVLGCHEGIADALAGRVAPGVREAAYFDGWWFAWHNRRQRRTPGA